MLKQLYDQKDENINICKEVYDGPAEESRGAYSAITNPDPQSVYTQVDRKKTIEVCASSSVESGTMYAALTNLDPQSVYTQVGQKKVKGVISEDSKPHNSLGSINLFTFKVCTFINKASLSHVANH